METMVYIISIFIYDYYLLGLLVTFSASAACYLTSEYQETDNTMIEMLLIFSACVLWPFLLVSFLYCWLVMEYHANHERVTEATNRYKLILFLKYNRLKKSLFNDGK